MADDLKIKVNGKTWQVAASPDTPLLYVLIERAAAARAALRLRAGAMRLLLGARRRRRNSLLRDAGGVGRRQIGDDARRPAGSLCGAEGAWRRRRRCIRCSRPFIDEQSPQCGYCYNGMIIKGSELLSQNPSPTEQQIRAHMNGHLCRCGTYPRDHEVDPARVHQNGGSGAMSDILTDTTFSRRDLLKGGGALIVGFSFAGGTGGPAAAARGDVAGPPDPNTVDTWIAVHADNTATVYFGKGEFGQGNTTGLLQIAGEELDLDMSQLKWVQLDTNVTPNQGATTSSSSIHRGGPQLRAAAAEARQALLASLRRGSACRPAASSCRKVSCRSTDTRAARSATARSSATSRSTSSSPARRRRSRSTATSWSAPACRASTSRTRRAANTCTCSTCACPACCTAASCGRAGNAPTATAPNPCVSTRARSRTSRRADRAQGRLRRCRRRARMGRRQGRPAAQGDVAGEHGCCRAMPTCSTACAPPRPPTP